MRYYIKEVNKVYDIVDRFTHITIIQGLLINELESYIKELNNLTIEEYFNKYLKNKYYERGNKAELEEWFKSAWMYTTNRVVNNHNIIEDCLNKEIINKLLNATDEVATTTDERKGVKKMLKKAKADNKDITLEDLKGKTEEEVRRLFIDKKISVDLFKQYKHYIRQSNNQ